MKTRRIIIGLLAGLFSISSATAQSTFNPGKIETRKLLAPHGHVRINSVLPAIPSGISTYYQWEYEALYNSQGTELVNEPYPSEIASRQWKEISGATGLSLEYKSVTRNMKFRRKVMNYTTPYYSNEVTVARSYIEVNPIGDTIHICFLEPSPITSTSLESHPAPDDNGVKYYYTDNQEYTAIITKNAGSATRNKSVSLSVRFNSNQAQYFSYTFNQAVYVAPPDPPTPPSEFPEGLQYSVTKSYYEADRAKFHRTITHYDALGRESEIIQMGASPTGGDIIQRFMYDNMGRRSQGLLPHVRAVADSTPTNGTGWYEYQIAKYGGGEAYYAFSKKIYDSSPLGILIAESGPGSAQSLNPTNYEYRLNTAADSIKHYIVIGNSVKYAGNYLSGELNIKKTSTPTVSGGPKQVSLEYADSRGLVVAKEVIDDAGRRRITYTVYDDMGRQRYVIPAIAAGQIAQGVTTDYTNAALMKYAYYSEYDKYGNETKKYVPGAGYTLALYDKRQRLVYSQSAKQRASNEWSFTKYDIFDRPVISGTCTGTAASLQAQLDAQTLFGEERSSATGNLHGYTNLTYPTNVTADDCLVVTYYDNYTGVLSLMSQAYNAAKAWNQTNTAHVKGMTTATKVKVLDSSPAKWLTTIHYYDDEGRTIQEIKDLYPSGMEITSNKHNFVGDVTQVYVEQSGTGTSVSYNKYFTYDDRGRLKDVKMQVTGDTRNNTVTVAAYTYDDMGEVANKKIHNNLETTTYARDILGRTTSIASPSFSTQIAYNLNSSPAIVSWGYGSTMQKRYEYAYNLLGEMTGATYKELSGSTWTNTTGKFNVSGVTYDKNGNLKTLLRKNGTGGTLHNLVYTYNGNQLSSLSGVTTMGNYAYDADGNMTKDGRTGVNITYNDLNLPSGIVGNSGSVEYIYDATGTKLAQKVGGSLTYYRGPMVYQGNALELIFHPEGMIKTNSDGSFGYYYFKTDHTGSNRKLLSVGPGMSGGQQFYSMQSTDYYPFGLAHSGPNDLTRNRYLYSGKEYQNVSVSSDGSLLGLYDFGARYYDPLLGRWFNPDPALQGLNPYVYCGNNPIMYVDPDGEWFFTSLLSAVLPGAGSVLGGILDAALWGATTGAATYTLNAITTPGGLQNWNWGDFGKSVGFSSLSGVATFGVGQMFGSPGGFGLEFGRGLTHGVVHGGIAALQGGSFWSGFASGSIGSWAGSGFKAIPRIGQSVGGMYAFSGIAGGLSAVASGGKFWQGAATGLMIAGLNHAQSEYQFYKDKKEAWRAMQDHHKKTQTEIVGVSATEEGSGQQGIVVWNDPNSKEDGTSFPYKEETATGTRFVRDGLFRKYILGDDNYHTHGSWNSMQTPSQDDIDEQLHWRNPLHILYNYRIWDLKKTSWGYEYQRTKITF